MIFETTEENARVPEKLAENTSIYQVYPLHAMEVKHTMQPIEIQTGVSLSGGGTGLCLVLPAPNDWAKGFLISPQLRPADGTPLVISARNVSGRTIRLNQQRPIAQVIQVRLEFEEEQSDGDIREGE